MGFLNSIDSHIIALVVGALMLIGSFATISSGNASKFDHDFALILLIAGVVSLGFGFKLIDLSQLKDLWP
jgi:hypothetical protein